MVAAHHADFAAEDAGRVQLEADGSQWEKHCRLMIADCRLKIATRPNK
jgi:hypothetical protein